MKGLRVSMFHIKNIVFVALCFAVMGCGSQQFGPSSRELMRPLQTAISAKKVEWVEATEEKIVDQHSEGKVSDDEYNTFEDIIAQTRSGDWQGAQLALHGLMSGQKPTSADQAKFNR